MKKYFRKWTAIKSQLNDIPKPPFFHEREIWFCHLGANIGHEENGSGAQFLRPVIVLKKFKNETLWAIPLTKTKKEDLYHFQFSFLENRHSFAILSQIRLIDARRLDYKKGNIKTRDLAELKQKLKALLP